MDLQLDALSRAANESRCLSMDAVAAAKSGHLGLPLGAAEIGAVLWGASLTYLPSKPEWLNRDRFVLSAGHGSMFLYSWLHLAGYDLSLEDIRAFRQLHSKTPGHPEFGETPGVEATTGPLGQGTGNLVGMAVAAKMAAARFNTAEHKIFDHHVIGLAGDGCIQEGISHEAAAFAGRFGLDNLIMFYDANEITLDAMADKTMNEDVGLRYEAYQWDVVTLPDGHDMSAIHEALETAKENDNGRPKLIICKTEVGRGIEEIAGTAKAHGEAGVKHVEEARKALGFPEERFYVSEDTRAFFKRRQTELAEKYAAWEKTFQAWEAANPELAKLLSKTESKDWGTPEELMAAVPEFPEDKAAATRATGGEALNHVAKVVPLLVSGSADLHGSTKNYLKELGDFDTAMPEGRNLYFGIREHAMGAIVNGMGYYGLFKASGATFLTFSDYMRPAVRLACLAKLPIFHVWTHDSVGVGEDGPTHQPVEAVSALRCLPNLTLIRPGDAEEAAAAVAYAASCATGPVGLVLSRQNVPNNASIPVKTRREGTLKGAYIAKAEEGELKLILMATGSELHLALEASAQLDGCRVVSMPSFELFEAQPADYREDILPPRCRKRVAIEAGVSTSWYRYVGLDGRVVCTDRFGLSAPGNEALAECGITVSNLVATAQSLG
ncbi:MAG: transketolase [Opitutales bacterium]